MIVLLIDPMFLSIALICFIWGEELNSKPDFCVYDLLNQLNWVSIEVPDEIICNNLYNTMFEFG